MSSPIDRFAPAAQGLAERGWTILRDLLPPGDVAALAGEARQLVERGQFRRAGVGRGAGHAVRGDVRSDDILWLDEYAATPAQARYWEAIEALRVALNRELFLGLAHFEGHYAIYPPGARYHRHVDRFSDADERVISCTFYLNPGWRAEHGGALRLYLAGSGAGDQADEHMDVLPEAGTCVLFRSDTFFHEVLPATQPRLSVTGWFRRRALGRVLC
jgi:SM-20-related protein